MPSKLMKFELRTQTLKAARRNVMLNDMAKVEYRFVIVGEKLLRANFAK